MLYWVAISNISAATDLSLVSEAANPSIRTVFSKKSQILDRCYWNNGLRLVSSDSDIDTKRE